MFLFVFYIFLASFLSWDNEFFSYSTLINPFLALIVMSFFFIILLTKDFSFETIFLKVMVLIGSVLVLISDNMIVLYLAMEIQTFSIFILISNDSGSISGSEAGLNYFMLGAISSGLILLGMSLLFSVTLSFDLNGLGTANGFGSESVWFGGSIFLGGLFFKLAIFPFHFWIADVYEGSSWEALTLISSLPNISILLVLLRLGLNSDFLVFCSCGSIIVGTVGAFNQSNFKSLIAYSGINNIGFILLGYCLLSNAGYESSIIYMMVYMLNLLMMIYLLDSHNFSNNSYIVEIAGLNKVDKILSTSWLFTILSLAGIPPFFGFVSNWLILVNMVDFKYLILVLIATLFSAISAGFYLSIANIVYTQSWSSYLVWKTVLSPSNNLYNVSCQNFLAGLIFYNLVLTISHPNILMLFAYSDFNCTF